MGAKNVIASQYLNCGYLPITRMRSVWLSSAAAPSNGSLRKSRNGRSRLVAAIPRRSAASASFTRPAYSFMPTMYSLMTEYDDDFTRRVAMRRMAYT